MEKVTHKNIQSLLDTQRLLLLDELEQCVELIANETGIFHTATATINAPMRPAAAATWPLAFLTASM